MKGLKGNGDEHGLILNRDELVMLWHRLNCAQSDFDKAYHFQPGLGTKPYLDSYPDASDYNMWRAVDALLDRIEEDE